MEEFWLLFIFKKGDTHYLVPAESQDDAWKQLQRRLSWNMDLVKQRCKLIQTMDRNSKIVKLK